MTTKQLIHHILRRLPFRKFRIHLADGRHVDVKHPDFIARSPGGRTAVVYTGGETTETIDLLLVTSLEVLNGQARKSRR